MSRPGLFHVVAMGRNRAIGKDNKLPWHFPEDLRYFKKLTLGSTVIMGRKTFESIGRPLPNRENFVLSRSQPGTPGGVRFFQTLEDALREVRTPQAFIIGGAELYRQTIEKADGIYMSRIDDVYEGDAFYPEIPDSFEEIEIELLREKDPRIEAVFYEKK
ncbi:MAG: dihydrofolate reductase [Candidatus Omnitrophica bacterium]|nr:dihydrofolate reductase [Candidatus Omnitrophota bacterium]